MIPKSDLLVECGSKNFHLFDSCTELPAHVRQWMENRVHCERRREPRVALRWWATGIHGIDCILIGLLNCIPSYIFNSVFLNGDTLGYCKLLHIVVFIVGAGLPHAADKSTITLFTWSKTICCADKINRYFVVVISRWLNIESNMMCILYCFTHSRVRSLFALILAEIVCSTLRWVSDSFTNYSHTSTRWSVYFHFYIKRFIFTNLYSALEMTNFRLSASVLCRCRVLICHIYIYIYIYIFTCYYS